jgi:hypothetical protein
MHCTVPYVKTTAKIETPGSAQMIATARSPSAMRNQQQLEHQELKGRLSEQECQHTAWMQATAMTPASSNSNRVTALA